MNIQIGNYQNKLWMVNYQEQIKFILIRINQYENKMNDMKIIMKTDYDNKMNDMKSQMKTDYDNKMKTI